jgi:hypothetical protein
MSGVDVHGLALAKVGRILGPSRAQSLLRAFLAAAERPALASPADLRAFGESLAGRGGIEQAVGALLMVQAALIEAAGPPEDASARPPEPS